MFTVYGSDAEEEEEEYNEYEGITGEGYDGPSEVSGSSSHGSRPPPSEPSVHREGWSDFDSPSPGPPSERRRKRLREGVDTPDDQDRAADGSTDLSLGDEPLSPASKMPEL